MDESKSGRALNSAEKAEADAPTNKQWLYTIGGPIHCQSWGAPAGNPPMIVRFR